jgi:GTP-binding protein YchF
MAIKIGLVGLSQSGKTTIFNALTGKAIKTGTFGAQSEDHIATLSVPDERIDYLANVYNPKKTTYAQVDFSDFGGQALSAQDRESGKESMSLKNMRQVDALAQVIRLFEDEAVLHPEGSLDAVRDVAKINDDLVIADMVSIEKRLEKLQLNIKKIGKAGSAQDEKEMEILKRLQAVLDEGKFISEVDLSADEKKLVKGFCFLTQKPCIYIANIGENEVGAAPSEQLSKLAKYADDHKIPWIAICGKMEMEIMELPEEERADYLKGLGVDTPGRNKLIQAAYSACNYISFLTAGEDEVRAWTITKGDLAPEAAGTIHTDFQQGFIRAEVCNFKDFVEDGGMAGAKQKGHVRLEGKEYVVQDGDIINFRFNV